MGKDIEEPKTQPLSQVSPEITNAQEVVPHRQWLYDRTTGKSKYEGGRPPCPLCWVPLPVGWYDYERVGNQCFEVVNFE